MPSVGIASDVAFFCNGGVAEVGAEPGIVCVDTVPACVAVVWLLPTGCGTLPLPGVPMDGKTVPSAKLP